MRCEHMAPLCTARCEACSVLADQIMHNYFICGLNSSWWLTVDALEIMRLRRVNADSVNLKSALTSVAAGSQWLRCLQMMTLALMQPLRLVGKMGQVSGLRGCERLSVTNAALTARWANWVEAHLVFQDLQRSACRPDQISVNTVIKACGEGDVATWTVALLLLKVVRIDLVGLNSALTASQRCSIWQTVLQLASSGKALRLQPDAYTASATLRAIDWRWQQALCLLEWSLSSPSLVAVNAAVGACARASEWEAALQLFEHMPQWRHLACFVWLQPGRTFELSLSVLRSV